MWLEQTLQNLKNILKEYRTNINTVAVEDFALCNSVTAISLPESL